MWAPSSKSYKKVQINVINVKNITKIVKNRHFLSIIRMKGLKWSTFTKA